MPSRCPHCAAPLTAAAETASAAPFCSLRCKLMDLGNWLGERYRIPEPLASDELEALVDAAERETLS